MKKVVVLSVVSIVLCSSVVVTGMSVVMDGYMQNKTRVIVGQKCVVVYNRIQCTTNETDDSISEPLGGDLN